MNINQFSVSNYQELRALQRVFREAKFCKKSDDDEIATSPIVAALFIRLMDALIETQVNLEGEGARKKWTRWLAMDDPSRDEWQSAKARAQKNDQWAGWEKGEKVAYVKILFSPFVLDDSFVDQFILDVNARA